MINKMTLKIIKNYLKFLKISKNDITFCVNFTAWQYNTFISIENAPIRNLTLFSIVAVDNHQLVQIIKSLGTPVVGKHIFV